MMFSVTHQMDNYYLLDTPNIRAADGSGAYAASGEETAPHRCQANARERYRTHSVNSAFTHLRTMIPTEPVDRKLSKIETLRLAKSYIEHLNAVLATGRLIAPCTHIAHPTKSRTVDERMGGDQRRRPNICTFCVASKVPDQ